jgi:hypothetical protein
VKLKFLGLAVALLGTACTPKATPTPVDIMGTAAQLAMVMQTQTVAAYSPTPPPPTITPTLSFTDTPTAAPVSNVPAKRPMVTEFTGCWTGPGPTYTLISNIDAKKRVDILGVGNTAGWYIIRNPYFHNPCWIGAAYLNIDPNTDISAFPVMTPAP